MADYKLLSETIPDLNIKDKEVLELLGDIRVEKIEFHKKDNCFIFHLLSEHPVHKRVFKTIETDIRRQITKGYKAQVTERFLLSSQYTVRNLLDIYGDSIKYELALKDHVMENLFLHSELDFQNDNTLILNLPASIFSDQKAGALKDFLFMVLNKRCGLKADIRIGNKSVPLKKESIAEKNFDETLKIAEDSFSDNSVETPEETPVNEKEEQPEILPAHKKSDDPDVVYGKDLPEEDLTELKDVEQYSGQISVRGEVMTAEGRELKSGKWIYMFTITDYTDSIKVKLFLPAQSYPFVCRDIKPGVSLRIKGTADLDPFDHEVSISRVIGIKKIKSFKNSRQDTSPEKYIELHCHTKMSDMDGMADAGDLVKRAYEWGQPAIAITDHGVVQSFPIANHALESIDDKFRKQYAKEHPDADKKELNSVHAPFKVIYGVEAYLADDLKKPVRNANNIPVDAPAVVFDIETTGFSPVTSRIIEIGAVKIENGKITDRFSTFVDPKVPVPYRIEKLTGINDLMLAGSPVISEVLPRFMAFCEGCYLVAHNADFDCGFIKKNCENEGLTFNSSYLDTVALARFLLPELKNYRLETVAKAVAARLDTHHRAVDDAECTSEIYLKLLNMIKSQGVSTLEEINEKVQIDAETIKKLPTYHAVILAKNETGRVNLYTLISKSHIDYFHSRPRIPKSVYKQYSEGLLISTACEAGELYRAMLRGASDSELADILSFYDYVEIQPVGNNRFMIESEDVDSVTCEEDIIEFNKKVARLAEHLGKPVVATGDVHFLEPEDELYRRIIQAGMGYSDADTQAPLYMKTTDEMLREFEYFGTEKAYEYVVANPHKIADLCERFSPIREGKYPPVIENSDNDLRDICYKTAHKLYGEELPKIVETRLERELTSIISNGYAVMYIIAQKLVAKSNSDGYLVGSRGSVGSSLVATMAGITEVNPLAPHYLCGNCHYVDFDSDEVRHYAGRCGLDMPDKACPVCGAPLKKMGFDIPFETFLGFKGNKEPDIDLNFSGEYQSKAHKYTEVIFGEGQTFRAGTISTLKDKTAYGFVRKYFESKGIVKRGSEMDRIVRGCTGVRRSTGQHPGGIIVLPHGENINSFTPVQHPANDMTTDIITTHFEYHSIDANLLKLDILGHDDPTMIRMLNELTGVDPLTIPLDEPKVMSLFMSTEALGITPEDIDGCQLGCLGIPEFGTEFVIQMLLDTKPTTFSELVRISGLSHGTDVWLGNAQTLIADGDATLSTAICTRDDIMTFLILKGMDSELSFTIMESVRKGKGLKPEWEEDMKAHDVPQWYIWSCKKIKYMFPKAHAAAYVMMAYRIAWFKIYYPIEYYTAFFTIRATSFNYETMCRGRERLEYAIREILKGEEQKKTDQDSIKDMKIVREMYARGIEFLPIDVYKASATKFKIIDGKIMPAINTLKDVGDNAAESIVAAAKDGPFLSKDDFKARTKVSAKSVEYMSDLGILSGLPETDQLSLFDL